MNTARSLLLVGVLLVARQDLVRAQDDGQAQQDHPRHGFWFGLGLGGGSGGFSADTGSQTYLGGWTTSLGLGWAPNPHVQLGAWLSTWMHGLSGDKLPGTAAVNLTATFYSRLRGGPFVDVGGGLSYYLLGKGTGDPIEPFSRDTTYYSGTGWGFTLGGGWEIPIRHGSLTPRLVYTYGNVGSLHAPDGAAAATGWVQTVSAVEVGVRVW